MSNVASREGGCFKCSTFCTKIYGALPAGRQYRSQDEFLNELHLTGTSRLFSVLKHEMYRSEDLNNWHNMQPCRTQLFCAPLAALQTGYIAPAGVAAPPVLQVIVVLVHLKQQLRLMQFQLM